MSRRALAGPSILAVLVTAAACGTFSEGAPATAGIDGGGTPDAGVGTVDAAPAPDASLAPATTCATATFCSGFETDPLESGFDIIKDNPSITLEIAPGNPPSNRSLRATLPAGQYSNDRGYFRRVFKNPFAKLVRLRFAAQVVSELVPTNIQIATVGWGDESSSDKFSEIQLRLENEKIAVRHDEDVGAGIDLGGTGTFVYTRNKWFDVDMLFTFGQSGVTTVDVRAGGQTLMSKTFTTLSVATDPDVGVGITGVDATTASSIIVDFDDVIVDVQ